MQARDRLKAPKTPRSGRIVMVLQCPPTDSDRDASPTSAFKLCGDTSERMKEDTADRRRPRAQGRAA